MRIKLAGAKNIRDFSEYGYKYYIRSAHLHKLTAGDIKILKKEYDLRTVIDLRTPEEVREKPDAKIPGVTYINIPVFEDAIPGITHENETDKLSRSIPDMPKMYELMATEEKHVRQLKKAMEVITDPNRRGGILWHCTEGKDRCGIISAMFLLSRGIQPERVMDDYLMTNLVNNAKARKFYFLIRLAGRSRDTAESVRSAFLAKREYLGPIMGRLSELSGEFADTQKAGRS